MSGLYGRRDGRRGLARTGLGRRLDGFGAVPHAKKGKLGY